MKTRDILNTVTRTLPDWHVYNDRQSGCITAFDPQAGYEVTVNGVTYQTGLETSFTLSGQAAGDYSYQVTARDAAGNAASTELRSFTLEEGAPDRYFRKLSGELSAASPAVSFGSFPLRHHEHQ